MRTTPLRTAVRVAPLAAILLALPATASASSLAAAPDGAIVFTGGAGGTYVDVDRLDDGRISFAPGLEDPIVGLPAGCASLGADEPVACAAPAGIRVVMNEGDDRVDVRSALGVPATIDGGDGADGLTGAYAGGDEAFHGGPGNDVIDGSTGNDTVDGGLGDDKLKGGTGIDAVLGGEGADKLAGDDGSATDPDVIDGGPGYDWVEFEWSTVGREGRGPVTVTLGGGADDGFAGEGDDVRGIEKLSTSTGGAYTGTDGRDELYVGGEAATVDAAGGDDTVYTSYANDTIDGGAGSDEIRGYSGDDRITGGPGADTLVGDTVGQTCMFLSCSVYSGNDVIDARDGERDSVDCGLGADTALVDAVDVHANCESVQVTGAAGGSAGPGGQQRGAGAGARLTAGRVTLRKALARGLSIKVSGAKAGRLVLTARVGRAKVGGCTVKVARTGTGRCTLRFTKAGKRRLRGARRATLRITGKGVSTTLSLKR